MYDRLSSPKLLELAKDTCELIYVGKENHKHVMKQESINELLFQKSNEYPLVVRLKGRRSICVWTWRRGGSLPD